MGDPPAPWARDHRLDPASRVLFAIIEAIGVPRLVIELPHTLMGCWQGCGNPPAPGYGENSLVARGVHDAW